MKNRLVFAGVGEGERERMCGYQGLTQDTSKLW